MRCRDGFHAAPQIVSCALLLTCVRIVTNQRAATLCARDTSLVRCGEVFLRGGKVRPPETSYGKPERVGRADPRCRWFTSVAVAKSGTNWSSGGVFTRLCERTPPVEYPPFPLSHTQPALRRLSRRRGRVFLCVCILFGMWATRWKAVKKSIEGLWHY